MEVQRRLVNQASRSNDPGSFKNMLAAFRKARKPCRRRPLPLAFEGGVSTHSRIQTQLPPTRLALVECSPSRRQARRTGRNPMKLILSNYSFEAWWLYQAPSVSSMFRPRFGQVSSGLGCVDHWLAELESPLAPSVSYDILRDAMQLVGLAIQIVCLS